MNDNGRDEVTEAVTGVAKEVMANKDQLRLNYRESAIAFGQIMDAILVANTRTIAWLDRFRYFDFDDQEGFNELMKDYHKLSDTHGYRQLKWSCTRIRKIYDKQIRPNIQGLLTNDEDVRKANTVFDLRVQDDRMIDYVKQEILHTLDAFVQEIEPLMEAGNIQEAKRKKLEFKTKTVPIIEQLKKLNEDLDNLVFEFDDIAG